MTQLPKVETLFPSYYENVWVGHSCKAILDGMQKAGAETQLSVLSCAKGSEEPNVHAAVPRKLLRFMGSDWAKKAASTWVQNRFIKRVDAQSIAYYWLNSPVPIIERGKRQGSFAVREMINCSAARRSIELERAYNLLGWENPRPTTETEVEQERAELLACDAVFCPNPMVRQSVLDYGVDPSACIDCSYGWSDQRFHRHPHNPKPHEGVHVLFVGTLDVRKGVPWLLQAWERAKIKGTLFLAGRISDELSSRGAKWLNQPNVVHLGHVTDLASIYDNADIFVFPSWEEGGPMVTLEAMAHGLPSIVTDMGTSGAVTQREGIIVEPGSVDALENALVRLAADRELRQALGDAAFNKSELYTWTRVGALRWQRLLELVNR